MSWRRVTSGRWSLTVLVLFSLPSTLLSTPTHWVHSKADLPKSGLQLKDYSLQLEKLRTASHRFSAPGAPIGSSSALNGAVRNLHPTNSSAGEKKSIPSLSTTLTVTKFLNKTFPVVGKAQVNTPHRKYLLSPDDSRWVAQCLAGGKCIKESSAEGIRQEGPVPERPALNNSIVDIGSTLSEILLRSKSGQSARPNQNSSSSSVPEESSQKEPESREIEMKIVTPVAVSSYDLVVLNMTEEDELNNSPLDLKSRPVEKDNRVVVPISLEKGAITHDSEENKEDEEELEGVSSIHPDVASDIEMGLQKVEEKYESLPVSIQLKPVIHNHYYNRRQTNSTQSGAENLSTSDSEFSPKTDKSQQDSSSTQEKMASIETQEETDQPKGSIRCNPLSSSGCGSWESVDNLAADDLVTRISTGKRQSDGNAVDGTELRNGTVQNIYLFMGGQWVVNPKDQTSEISKMKSKASDSNPNIMLEQKEVLPLKNEELASPHHSWSYKTSVADPFQMSNIRPQLLSTNYYPFIGETNTPPYFTQNKIPATPSYGTYPNTGYYQAQGGFDSNNWENGYYQTHRDINQSPGNNLPSLASAKMNYPDSLVNFPLSKINEHQGDDMGYLQTQVKPEEYALHDMNPSDMLIVGAQLLSSMQTPEVNVPDVVYPLEPIIEGNDDNSAPNAYSRESSTANFANPPVSTYTYMPYQIPSIYNSSYSAGDRQVFLPQKIVINGGNPTIPLTSSNPWTMIGGEYDFVNGQYVKTLRGAEVSPKNDGIYGEKVNPSMRRCNCCQQKEKPCLRTTIGSDVSYPTRLRFVYGQWPSQNVYYPPIQSNQILSPPNIYG